MMKYVFILVLLVVAATGGLFGLTVAYRWLHNMFDTPRVMPSERALIMPPGSLPRTGGELYYSKEERDAAAVRKNPVAATPASVKQGAELYVVYCTPCHGVSAKGDGLVSTKFVPPPDLTNPDLQKQRSDGYWESVLSVGGAIMPAYSEALSPHERWSLVNYLRTLAGR